MDTAETTSSARGYARHEDLTSDSPQRRRVNEEAASPEPPRHSLAFILDQGGLIGATHPPSSSPTPSHRSSRSLSHVECAHGAHALAAAAVASFSEARDSALKRTREDRRKTRGCTIAGCSNYTIDRGLCFRHGGGKQCSIDGCSTSAKHRGLCWKHGGSIGCTVGGCTRGAKSKGLCWSHGGANKCTISGCEKLTISKGLCWTHGGGKRCSFEGCKRPMSKKTLSFCTKHGAEVNQVDYVFEVYLAM